MSIPIKSSRPILLHTSAIDDFSRESVRFFAEAVRLFGVPPSVGQIYGLLYTSQEPLSFSDIIAKLDISRGSASQGLNLLRSLAAVHSVSPGPTIGRREYFYPELSLRKLLSGVMNERVSPLAGKSLAGLDRLRRLAKASSAREMTFRLARVKQLEIWRRRLDAIVPILIVLLGPKSRR